MLLCVITLLPAAAANDAPSLICHQYSSENDLCLNTLHRRRRPIKAERFYDAALAALRPFRMQAGCTGRLEVNKASHEPVES